jgi:hypothetical protein
MSTLVNLWLLTSGNWQPYPTANSTEKKAEESWKSCKRRELRRAATNESR